MGSIIAASVCTHCYVFLFFFICDKESACFFCREVVKSKCGEGEATKALWLWLGKD